MAGGLRGQVPSNLRICWQSLANLGLGQLAVREADRDRPNCAEQLVRLITHCFIHSQDALLLCWWIKHLLTAASQLGGKCSVLCNKASPEASVMGQS